jgi:hypothetical protein
MPTKKPTKRAAHGKSLTPFDVKQAELDAARKLRRMNQTIAAEAKSAERWMKRADIVLGRVMSAYHERTGLIAVDGATYAGLLDRVEVLTNDVDRLNGELEVKADQLRERAAAEV